MGSFSSLSCHPPSLFSPPTFPRITSSLLPPLPRKKRPNRLRPKLPQTLIPDLRNTNPIPTPTPTSPPPDAAQYSLLREEVAEERAVLEVNGAELLLLETSPWFPGGLLGLSLRFAALLAVQTVAAVWLLGGAARSGGEERRGGGDPKEEEAELGGEAGKVEEFDGGGTEFERKVMEIRAMAREARLSEARSVEDRDSYPYSPSKNAGGKSNRARLNTRKGFDDLKRDDGDGANGGIQQIAALNLNSKSHELRQASQYSSNRKDEASVKDFLVSPSDEPAFADSLLIPRGGSIQEDERYPGNPADVSKEALDAESNPAKLETDVELGTSRNTWSSSTYSRTSSSKSKYSLQTEGPEGKLGIQKNEDSQFHIKKNPWWLNLPYVFAIYLSRGIERDGPKGIYSLKMNYTMDEGSFPSYTVAFQDPRDATNFCYLIESFFEELGDFSADIVPLTIQELLEAVESNELQIIVVRKGELQLYAGQPLSEAESTLRQLVDKNLHQETDDTMI